MADSGDIQQYKTIRDTFSNYYTSDEIDKIINDLLQYPSIGGKIFYDAGDNGAIYTFYDKDKNIISDTSISSLQNAVYYLIEGTPSKDRFYVVYPELLNSGDGAYWGFHCNTDIYSLSSSSKNHLVTTRIDIGTGKGNTKLILNYISTYASSETASKNTPSSAISQSSPNGYNLYKNCGTTHNYLWDIIKNVNRGFLGGHNDWFIPSEREIKQIGTSGIISDITSNNNIWSSSAYYTLDSAFRWRSYGGVTSFMNRYSFECVVACRAF